MSSSAPLWSVLVLPPALVVTAFVTAGLDAALDARRAGRAAASAATAPLSEAARLLVQQRRTTIAADSLLWRLGVVVLPVAAVLAALILPLGFRSAGDLGVGVVWFNAMEVLSWSAVWLVGWGPNSPYGLIGGYRFVVQGLAYELPHMLSLITAALAAETLRVGGIVDAQAHLWFVVWMPVAFVLFLLSALAMACWGPFDHPLSVDVAGGAAAELSGVDRLVFLGGRRLLFVVAAAMSVPLFLGGGHGPLLPPWLWTLLKTAVVLALLATLRRRLPTLRMERYAELAWVVLVPLAILQALVVSLVVLAR